MRSQKVKKGQGWNEPPIDYLFLCRNWYQNHQLATGSIVRRK